MGKEIIKLSEISKEYSRILAERLAEGYVLNARTTPGTQGEYGRMDLTKDGGKTVRRLYLDKGTDYGYDKDDHYAIDFIKILEEEFDNSRNSDTLWNGKGNTVFEKKYYKIDRKRSVYEMNPYTSYTLSIDTVKAADEKHYDRADALYNTRSDRTIRPTQKMVEVVNRFKGFKNVKLADIEKVEVGKYTRNGVYYRFTFNNRKHTLTIDYQSKYMQRN